VNSSSSIQNPKNPKTSYSSMASSSSMQETVPSNQEASGYEIRGRTMSVEE